MLNHLPCGDVALASITWVWRTLVRQIKRVVQLLGRKGCIWRSDNNILLAYLLDEGGVWLHDVTQRLLLDKILRESLLIAATLLV